MSNNFALELLLKRLFQFNIVNLCILNYIYKTTNCYYFVTQRNNGKLSCIEINLYWGLMYDVWSTITFLCFDIAQSKTCVRITFSNFYFSIELTTYKFYTNYSKQSHFTLTTLIKPQIYRKISNILESSLVSKIDLSCLRLCYK